MNELQEHIQQYLNSVIYFSDRCIPINEANLYYLSQRVYMAFRRELNDWEVYLQPDEQRNIILTLFPKEITFELA